MSSESWKDLFFLKTSDGSVDTHQLDAAFPELADEKLTAIRAFGEEHDFPAGSTLFRRGDRDIDFYVILRGTIEVCMVDHHGEEHSMGILRERTFAGEMIHFAPQRVFVSARTLEPTRVLRVRKRDFRRMLAADPELEEIILRAFILRRKVAFQYSIGGVTLIGVLRDPETFRLRQFLTRNGFPHKVLSPDAPARDGRSILTALSLQSEDLPVVWIDQQKVLKHPSLAQLASEIGLFEELPPDHTYDLAIVGAGPAGLSAAVYAASEGCDTVVLEEVAPGGQAGTTSRIENFLGFPNGISGAELAARAEVQAAKFSARMAIAAEVISIKREKNGALEMSLRDQGKVRSRAVIIASGAKYRKLDIPGYERYEGRGIHYSATAIEAQLCTGEEVVVIGGGNSAGQAAIYLSRFASRVYLLVRAKILSKSMSNYLIKRIQASSKIRICYETELKDLMGQEHLERVEWQSRGQEKRVEQVRNLFVMIGAIPNTEWLKGCVELDQYGFILTGKPKVDQPQISPYQTSEPGIFAVGDVRAGSAKRVASAVGEGSVVVQGVHQYLDDRAALTHIEKAA